MGKRKSSKKAPPKAAIQSLATQFKCLFCNHEKAVSVKLDKQTMFGHLLCKVCGQRFSTPINMDVFCESVPAAAEADEGSTLMLSWTDACEEANLKAPKKVRPSRAPSPLEHGSGGGASFSVRNGPIARADEDAEAEDDDDDDDAEDARAAARRRARRREQESDDDDDAEEEEDDDRGKRRRVAASDGDE